MPRTLPILLSLLALSAATALWPAPAQAQVRRCAGPDGNTIFTDRRCNDIGAIERLPRDDATGASRIYRRGCSRNLQDLIYEITTAVDNRDVNRLAGVYHWTGMGTTTGYALMDRLAAIVQRPLVDIVPVMPAAPSQQDRGFDGEAAQVDNTDTSADAAAPPVDLYPQATVRRAPVALRLEQTLANGSTPSRTVFGLRRNLGCLWVTL